MKKKRNLLLAVLMAFTLISCGSDNDDNDDDTPQQEEDTTGSNGTTGISGTTGTTGGTTTSCLTNTQRENIRTFLNRASDLRTFSGTGKEIIREEPGLPEVNDVTGTFDFVQSGENTWIVNAAYCNTSDGSNCQSSLTVIAFRNGCLNVNGVRARLNSASDSTLSYRYLENGTVNERASLATGKLLIRQTVRRDGITPYEFNFAENP